MPFLRQSTAQTIRFGPFLDAGDGVTEEVALTITPALRRLSKDGGAFAAASGAVNATHDSDGWYSASLTTTDTNTVGELILNVQTPATHLPVWMRWWVLEEAVYDAMYGASAGGPLQPTVAGRTLDVTATGAAGIDWANVENPTTALDLSGTDIQLADTVTTLTNLPAITANWLTAAGIAATALNGKGDWNIGKTGYTLTQAFPANFADLSIVVTTGLVDITQAAADKVWSTAARILTASTNFNDIAAGDVWAVDATTQQTQGTFGQAIGDPVADADTIYGAVVTGATGANIAADIVAVKADTDNIQTRLPIVLVGGKMDSDMTSIAGVAASATNLERGAKALVTGAAVGTPTTTVIDTDLTEATTDHYKTRIITFTTGPIAGQSTDITAYNGTTKELTVTALTDAPSATDEFVIS